MTKHSGWNTVTKHSGWNTVTKHSGWNTVIKHSGWNTVTKHSGWNTVTKHSGWNTVTNYIEHSGVYESLGIHCMCAWTILTCVKMYHCWSVSSTFVRRTACMRGIELAYQKPDMDHEEHHTTTHLNSCSLPHGWH